MPSTEKLICHASSTPKFKIMCSSRILRSTITPVRGSRFCTSKILTHMIITLATPGWTALALAQEMLGQASRNMVATARPPGSVFRRLLIILQHANFYRPPILTWKTAWIQAQTHQKMPGKLSGSHLRSSTPQDSVIAILSKPAARRAWNSSDWTWLQTGRLRKQALSKTSRWSSTRLQLQNWAFWVRIRGPPPRVSRGPHSTS